MDLKSALDGVHSFFAGENHIIQRIVDAGDVRGQRQEDECRPHFDHCFVDQRGPGICGDDFHGHVYFSLGDDQYLQVEYWT